MATSERVTVQDFMSNKPIHINEEDSISFVVNMFERARISGAPVINGQGDYVGVITKTDLTGRKLLKFAKDLDKATARDFMCPDKPLCIAQDAPLEQAVEMMLEHHVHRLFIVDESGHIIGVISSFDIMKSIRRDAHPLPALSMEDVLRQAQAPPPEKPAVQAFQPEPDVPAEPEAPGTDPPARRLSAEEQAKLAEREKIRKDREIEKRIFQLISKKQEQLVQQDGNPPVPEPPLSNGRA